jgi:hypothetical protein
MKADVKQHEGGGDRRELPEDGSRLDIPLPHYLYTEEDHV